MFNAHTVRSYPIEFRAYDGSWHRMGSVDHVDIDGAAAWAGRRLAAIKRAGVPLPIRPLVRVTCPVSDHTRITTLAA